MSRSLFFAATAALCLAMAGSGQNATKKSALDKATLEAYVRHLYVMDKAKINVEIADPTPSAQLPGFFDVKVHAWAGQQSYNFTFFVSKDGSKIVQGSVFDANSNPFKNDLDKLKTEFA